MNVGMMWFDDDPKTTLVDKIERAAKYYRQKYGLNPNVCFVNPSLLPEPAPKVNIAIVPYQPILKWNFWIGIREHN